MKIGPLCLLMENTSHVKRREGGSNSNVSKEAMDSRAADLSTSQMAEPIGQGSRAL